MKAPIAKNYFILKPAVDTKETGNAYPSAESYDDYDFNAPNSVHKLTFREFPNFQPDIKFKLAKGAKLTDMLSQAAISAHGFLINEKLKNAFEQFDIVPHKYYPARIEDHQGNFHNYFWMHFAFNEDILIWNKCDFVAKRFSKIIDELSLNSYQEYYDKSLELGGKIKIVPTKISLSTEYNIFTLPLGIDIFIDNRVKEVIQQMQFSGTWIMADERFL